MKKITKTPEGQPITNLLPGWYITKDRKGYALNYNGEFCGYHTLRNCILLGQGTYE